MTSTLEVSVLQGRNLLAGDFGISSDPYCVLQLHGDPKTSSTRVVAKNLNPVWNQDFTFDSIKGSALKGSEILEVRVLDRDRGRFDDALGSTAVKLEDLGESWTEEWYPLSLKGKPSGEVKLKCRLLLVDDEEDNDVNYSSVKMHGWVHVQKRSRYKATGRWKQKYLVCFKNLPESIYSFKSKKNALQFIAAYPNGLDQIQVKFGIIEMSRVTKVRGFNTPNKNNSSGSMRSMISIGSENSEPKSKLRRNSIPQTLFPPPNPETVTKLVTANTTYKICTDAKEDALKWLDVFVNHESETATTPVGQATTEQASEPEVDVYARPSSNSEANSEDGDKIEDVFVENPKQIEHIIEGTLSLQSTFRRRKQHAVLTPHYLAHGARYMESASGYATKIHLSQVISVAEDKNRQEPSFTIILNESALQISQSPKLRLNLFGEEDGNNFRGPEFERRTFFVSSPTILDAWVKKIEIAVKERQQNLHLWKALEEGIKVTNVIKFLRQGASAGLDNKDKNDMLLFHHAVVNLHPKDDGEEKQYLMLLDVLAKAYPAALKTTIAGTKGYLPLHYAISSDHPNFRVVEFLLKTASHTAYTRTSAGDAAIHVACRWGSPYATKLLLEACSACASFANNARQLPLHCAVGKRESESTLTEEEHNERRVEILKILFMDPQMSNFVASIDKSQITPLHLACKYQGLSVVKMLINANPKCLACNDHFRNRPFHYACQRIEDRNASIHSIDIAVYVGKRLFSDLKNDDGKTPLQLITSPVIRNRVKKAIEAAKLKREGASEDVTIVPPTSQVVARKTGTLYILRNVFGCCAGNRKVLSQGKDTRLFQKQFMEEGPAEDESAAKSKPKGTYLGESGVLAPLITRYPTDEYKQDQIRQIIANKEGLFVIEKTAQEIEELATTALAIEGEVGVKALVIEQHVNNTLQDAKEAGANLVAADASTRKKSGSNPLSKVSNVFATAKLTGAVTDLTKS